MVNGRWTAFGLLMLVLGAVAACGGKTEGDDEESSAPAAQCRTFIETWCGRAIGCLEQVGTLQQADHAQNLDLCVDVGADAARCGDAIGVSANYNQCLADIGAKPCSDWAVPQELVPTVTPPSSCNGVTLLP